MKKVKNFLPVLGIGAITFLTQLSMSGSSVGFESEELSNIGSNITSGAGSLIYMIIQLLPLMIFVFVIGFVIMFILNIGQLKIVRPGDKETDVFGKKTDIFKSKYPIMDLGGGNIGTFWDGAIRDQYGNRLSQHNQKKYMRYINSDHKNTDVYSKGYYYRKFSYEN